MEDVGRYFCLLIVIGCYFSTSTAFIEGLYCGKDNCYEVLRISRDSSKSDIAKAYRQLAKQYHPDRHRKKDAKEKAEEKFKLIATAYEILKDEDTRKDYDYMLDNPDEVYRHYFHYYRRRMAPKVDVRYVIAVSITVISVLQYLSAKHRYSSAINYLASNTKYRNKALSKAKERGLLQEDGLKKRNKRTKEEIRLEEDEVVRKVLEENMDIRGGYAKPKITDVLWIRIIFLPYTTLLYIWFHTRWFYKFTLKQEEYGEEEKLYLIKSYLNFSQTQWDAIDSNERQKFLKLKLWIKENFDEWQLKEEENKKTELAESGKYRRYRRYMKNHGPGQITFED